MKKLILLLIAAFVLHNVSAQIAKEHAFDDQASIGIQMVRLENSGQKICLVNSIDSNYYRYVFYNNDYSEYKTITIDLEPLFIISEYNSPYLYLSYMAETVFDRDEDIDLLCQLFYYDDDNAEYAQVLVFHEDGSVLFQSDVENTNAWLFTSTAVNSTIVSSLTNSDVGAKMILDVFYINDRSYSYDVYSLPGTLPTALAGHGFTDEQTGNYLNVYPVPARNTIYMDYQLNEDQPEGTIEISNAQGATVRKVRVDAGRGIVSVPAAQYSDGIYMVKLNTKRGVSRSGKLIIVK